MLVVTSKSQRNRFEGVDEGVIGVTGIECIELIGVIVVFEVLFVVVFGVVNRLVILVFEVLLLDARFSKHILACFTLIGMLSSSLISIVEDHRPLLIRFCLGCFRLELVVLLN